MDKIDGLYVCPSDELCNIQIKDGKYILDYGDGGNVETGLIVIENDILYTIEQEEIDDKTYFKTRQGFLLDNQIKDIFILNKEIESCRSYLYEDEFFKKTLNIYEDGTFEFEYFRKNFLLKNRFKNSAYNNTINTKNKLGKSGVYKKIGNKVELIIMQSYEKNIFNKKINIKDETKSNENNFSYIINNYYIDKTYEIDRNGNMCVIKFKKKE